MHNQTLNENAIVVQSAKRRSFETDNFRTQSFGRFTLTDKLVCIDKLYNLNIIAYSINTKRAHKKLQSNVPLYNNTVIGTLAADG